MVGVLCFSGLQETLILEPTAAQRQTQQTTITKISDDTLHSSVYGDACVRMLWACGRWGRGCGKCKMKHEAGEQGVMNIKVGCQHNWVGRTLNSNQSLYPSERGGSSLALH